MTTLIEIVRQAAEAAVNYVDEEAMLKYLVDAKIVNPIPDELSLLVNTYSKGPKNLCVECSVDMGPTNPRQLCGKTYCNNSW